MQSPALSMNSKFVWWHYTDPWIIIKVTIRLWYHCYPMYRHRLP